MGLLACLFEKFLFLHLQMFAKLALLGTTLNENKYLNQFVCFLVLEVVARFLDHFPFSSTELFFCQKLIKIAAYHLSYIHCFVHGSVHGPAICWLGSPQSISLPLYWWAHNFFLLISFVTKSKNGINRQTLLSVC